MSAWAARVGLEIHVQIDTATKCFCSCPTAPASPNQQVCPVCYGLPGALPVLNRQALVLGCRLAGALNGRFAETIAFDRKHYFYPDLPKGYQITQHRVPLATGGTLPLPDGTAVPIREVHLEEDAAKSRHRADTTLVDFNRAGIPLLEIVTEPTLNNGNDAAQVLRMIRTLVRYLDIGSGDMESGGIRCDANVSLQGRDGTQMGPVELKNLNAMRFVRQAVNSEIQRLTRAARDGGSIPRETRFYDEKHHTTRPGRSKESRPDYRYLPEPDLPPAPLDPALLQEAAWHGELPWQRTARWIREWHIPDSVAWTLAASHALASYAEQVAQQSGYPRLAALRIASDLRHALAEHHLPDDPPPVPAARVARLVAWEAEGKLTRRTAQELLAQLVQGNGDMEQWIADRGLDRPLSEEALAHTIETVLAAHRDAVAAIHSGRHQAMGFLIGQVLRQAGNRADPQTVRRLIQEAIFHG